MVADPILTTFMIELSVLKMKIWIYWSESNSWIYFCIYWFWAGRLVLIVRTAVISIVLHAFLIVVFILFGCLTQFL